MPQFVVAEHNLIRQYIVCVVSRITHGVVRDSEFIGQGVGFRLGLEGDSDMENIVKNRIDRIVVLVVVVGCLLVFKIIELICER